MELADTSAWTTKNRDPAIADAFDVQARTGGVATCDVVRFELLVGARDHHDFVALREELDSLPEASISPRVWRRALDVYELFAQQGPLHHRRVQFPDLLVAAAAELAELPVLHYDRHFELIADVTGQPVR
ncbi:MAG: PIN domain-containing protein, partial [Gaiellales bacterium]